MDKSSLKSSLIHDETSKEYDSDETEDLELSFHADIKDDSDYCEELLEINDFDNPINQKKIQNLQPADTSAKVSNEKKKDLLTSFKNYLKCDGTFNFDVILKCSAKKISEYLKILLDYIYKNFRSNNVCEEVLFYIYKYSRYTVQGKAAFTAASSELFEQEFAKISSDSNWNNVVMFGALLCELLPYHKADNFVITKQLNVWLMELVKYSAEGYENALIALMLILKRLKKIFNPLNGSYDQLLVVLKILLKNEDCESKKIEISNFLDHAGYQNLEDYEPLEALKYKKETENSTKCQTFENFLTDADHHALFNVAMFTDLLETEIKFFARKFIEVGIQEPHKMKYLAYTAYRFQQVVMFIRKIAASVVKKLDEEIEVVRKNEGKGSIPIINLAKFIAEVYVYEEELIPTKNITNLLSLLSELGETVPLVTTLKICGGIYENLDSENFDKYFQSLGVMGTVVKDEMKKFNKLFDNNDNIVETYLKYYKSRRFKPAEGAKMTRNFSLLFSELSKDKNFDFDYLNLYECKHHDSIKAVNAIIQELTKPTSNVIKLAEFFKSFFEFSVKLGKFVIYLKEIFLTKISGMSADRPDEMMKIGKLIAELRNLAIIEKYPQDKWLDMIESLRPDENSKILEVYLEVLKVMMCNLYIHEENKYMKYHKYIKAIDTTDTKIKSKVIQITQNLIHKKIDKESKSVFIKMKSGWVVNKIPSDILDTSPTEFDLHDFVKLYFISTTKNPFFMDNYLKYKKFLSIGHQGRNFDIILKKLVFDRFKNITNPEYFDEYEAVPTLQFILMTNSRSIYRENSVATFLNNILEFKDFDAHKDCFRVLVQMLKKSNFGDIPRSQSHDIFCLLRKVQAKFIKIEEFSTEIQEEVEIWHLVDYQGCTNDSDTKSIEPSQLAWSFTENYHEKQEKIQKILENSNKSPQNIDNLAQNFKDFTQNFHKIQHPGRNVQNFVKSQSDQNNPNLSQNDQNMTQYDQRFGKTEQNHKNSAFSIKILPENPQNSSQNQQMSTKTHQRAQNYTNYNQRSQRVDRKNQKPKIEWNVSRGDLRDRSDLQHDDLPNLKKRFDHKSPLYQGSSHSGRDLDQTE